MIKKVIILLISFSNIVFHPTFAKVKRVITGYENTVYLITLYNPFSLDICKFVRLKKVLMITCPKG